MTPYAMSLFTATRGKGAQLNDRIKSAYKHKTSLEDCHWEPGFPYGIVSKTRAVSIIRFIHKILPICGDIREQALRPVSSPMSLPGA